MQYYNIHHTDFKSTLEIYLPRLCRKTKISGCIYLFIFFFSPVMAKTDLRHFYY